MAPLPLRLLAAIVAVTAVLVVGAAPTWAQGQAEESVEGFWNRVNLLGDPGEVRSRLETRGLTFSLSETSEVLGNPTGGRRRAVVYAGLTRFTLAVDTAAAFGLLGGSFFMSGFHIHGRGLSANALGSNLHTVSSLEPPNRGTRLVLLCHKFLRRAARWQHGHRGRVLAIVRAMVTRRDAIEFVTWRSGRIGGAAGSVTVGKAMFFEEKGVALS